MRTPSSFLVTGLQSTKGLVCFVSICLLKNQMQFVWMGSTFREMVILGACCNLFCCKENADT